MWPHCDTIHNIRAALHSLAKDWRTMKSNRLSAVHRRGEILVMGNPQVSGVGDLGNVVVGVCRRERRRKGREVSNIEA